MSHANVSLSYSARREVLAHIAPHYQEASVAQKTLFLDQIVELTGYKRKYAIRLLNHDPKGVARILRPRQPIYGSAVQEALFLAWRTIRYPCAKRLIPLLGLDTDNGGEFLNTILLSYCQQEQLTFTRSRPGCSNDNAHVEQKNGAVVRKIVGHDRLVSMLAYQQLGELYQAARFLVNGFQPSMKLQSKQIKGEHEQRIYDEAKTPWQRVLLAGVLSEEKQQQRREAAEVLDPLQLVQHVEALQQAVWRCAEGCPGTTLVRFSLSTCVSAAASLPQISLSPMLAQVSPVSASVRDWSRSMDDPFLGEWEQIHAYVRARPMARAGEILREWQRRFPERFVDAHLNILQRRLREMRASLVAPQAEPGGGQMDGVTASHASSELTPARETVSPLADTPAVVLPAPVPAPSFLPPIPEEEARPLASPFEGSLSKKSGEDQLALIVRETLAVSNVDAHLPSTMTIDSAINLFLQGEHTSEWSPKTRE